MPVSGGGFEQAYNAQAAVDASTLLAVMNSSVVCKMLRSKRRSNIHLYPDDWKTLLIVSKSIEKCRNIYHDILS